LLFFAACFWQAMATWHVVELTHYWPLQDIIIITMLLATCFMVMHILSKADRWKPPDAANRTLSMTALLHKSRIVISRSRTRQLSTVGSSQDEQTFDQLGDGQMLRETAEGQDLDSPEELMQEIGNSSRTTTSKRRHKALNI
jgi:hypothetical protein